MPKSVPGLSRQAIDNWISELNAQVPELAALRPQNKRNGEEGYYHTLREICQQPLTWLNTSVRACDSFSTLRRIVAESGVGNKRGAIILTGSGSSLYAAECLTLTLQAELAVPVHAIPAGSILTHPDLALSSAQASLAVSLARSGDSPESTAVVELLDKACPGIRHLVITCNHNGRLAVLQRNNPGAVQHVLDDGTWYRSLGLQEQL